jgi:replicative DNA helicase
MMALAKTEPLYDLEFEFLASVLFSKDVVAEVVDCPLKPHHFGHPAHARIYETVIKEIEAGRNPNLPSINAILKDDPEVKAAGGIKFFGSLAHGLNMPSKTYVPDLMRAAMKRHLETIGRQLCEYAADPEIDPEKITSEAVKAIEQALDGGGNELISMASAAQTFLRQADAARNSGGTAGIPTGLADLDRKMSGLHPTDLIILAGRPAMGKSALAQNIAEHIARTTGPVLFFSQEMSADQLAGRSIAAEVGLPGDMIRNGRMSDADFERAVHAGSNLAACRMYIDDKGAISSAHVRRASRRAKRQLGGTLALIVIDYIQLMREGGSRDYENRVQEITRITTNLKAIAKELDVPILALSQLNRGVDSRDNKRPQLSDLRDSGSIEQDADIVLMLYREEYYVDLRRPSETDMAYQGWLGEKERTKGLAEIIVAKNRRGPVGAVDVHFNGGTTKFSNLQR